MAPQLRPNQNVFSEAGAAKLLARTCPELLFERVRQTPDDIVFRDKHLGIYTGISWLEYGEIVREVGFGLRELGVTSGDRVALMGDACLEWVLADMAAMAVGGITVGVYPTSSPNEVAYIMKDSGASIFIAETQEHLDKLLVSLDSLPELRRIVVIDTRALFNFRHERVITFSQLRELGRTRAARYSEEFDRGMANVRADDAAAIVYTSGTTGPPKGAVLSHRNLIAGAMSYINCHPDMLHSGHRMVAHLPLSHVVARVAVVTTPLLTKLVIFFCEEIDEFSDTIREVAPNFVIMPPRFYEKFAAQLLVGIETSTRVKRAAYRSAEAIGRKVLRQRRSGQSISLALRVAHWAARGLVFKQLLEKIGFANAKIAFTGSAPMPPQIVEVWQLWGVDLRELYGVTECCGISIAQYHSFPAPGDIGVPAEIPGFEFKLSDKGEIRLRSPMLFKEYWGLPDATAEVRDAEGWYHTGDVAEITGEGRVKLVDRLRDIIVTSGGKTLSPQQIEKVVKGSPFISEAVVFGDGRRFITALLELDYTTVSEWARTYKVPYTSYTNLVTRPEVIKLIETEVERANQYLSRVEQVKVFRIIPIELDPEQGETTPTRKIKRGLMYDMFSELVEAMYRTTEDKLIATQLDKIAAVR
jgi:long-chain acyl-CoA synthetase